MPDYRNPTLEASRGYQAPAPGWLRLTGFISKPELEKLNRNSIYCFVNRRLVRDRLLLHVVWEAYRNILPPTSFPVVLLFVEMPAEEVDVNVHPAKTEVRFRQASWLHDFVRDTIRHKLTLGRPAAGFLRALTVHPSILAESGPPRKGGHTNLGWLDHRQLAERWLVLGRVARGRFRAGGRTGRPADPSTRPIEPAPGMLPFAPFASSPAAEKVQNGHSPGCATAIEQLASAEAGGEADMEATAEIGQPGRRSMAWLRCGRWDNCATPSSWR